MVCDKCGTEVTKNDKFCPKCGAEVVNKRDGKKDIPEVEEYKLKDKEIEKLSQSFASRDEKYIASLGNGYIMNFLTNKSVKRGFAFLSNKRVYFKGSCLSGTGKLLVKTNEERTVDVKNITGSGFIYKRKMGFLLAIIPFLMALSLIQIAFVFLVNAISHLGNSNLRYAIYNGVASVGAGVVTAIIIAIIFKLKDYLFGRKTLFRIEYAGGCIAFDVSFYAKSEIDDFQKQLRRVKDLAEETATIKTVAEEAPVQAHTQSSVPDDLRKYADLLKEGLISQEEYDAMKKKILGL